MTSLKHNEILSAMVFDSGDFPVLSAAFQCMIQTSLGRAEEYCRRVDVDIIYVGVSDANPSLTNNIVSVAKVCPTAQVIALVDDMHEAQLAFSHGAADCIIRAQLTAGLAEQRALFTIGRARYMRHGGEHQLYTHSDLAAIARVLSHDIRNSLSGIVLSIEPIRQAVSSNADAKSYIDILERSVAKLTNVINRFSSATGNIALRPKDENMVEIIRHAIDTLPETSGRKPKIIQQHSQDEIVYSIDREKFPLIVESVLHNAIEAIEGRSDGQIDVKTEVIDRDIILTIGDNGHGIDFTTLQNVFRPFFTTRPGKAGLGLPLARSIAIAHGGNFRIESSNGIGTTVQCRFPLNK